YLITRDLIIEGRSHLIMRQAIPLAGPVRLLHGMTDAEVPYQTSLDLAARIASADLRVTLIKDGDHRLSRDQDLALLTTTLGELLG
ncbi:MAG TPA: alpha/beta hydrolase, partial [Stellaceae bacterium]|nr:alpha/beta hydrolase [Stellaceae bacterium]